MSDCTFNLFCGGFVIIYHEIFHSWLYVWLILWSWSVEQLPVLPSVYWAACLLLSGQSHFYLWSDALISWIFQLTYLLYHIVASCSCWQLPFQPPLQVFRQSAVCLFWHFSSLLHLLLCALSGPLPLCGCCWPPPSCIFWSIFLIVSAEIQSFCCGFFLPNTSSHVVFTDSLMWL